MSSFKLALALISANPVQDKRIGKIHARFRGHAARVTGHRHNFACSCYSIRRNLHGEKSLITTKKKQRLNKTVARKTWRTRDACIRPTLFLFAFRVEEDKTRRIQHKFSLSNLIVVTRLLRHSQLTFAIFVSWQFHCCYSSTHTANKHLKQTHSMELFK